MIMSDIKTGSEEENTTPKATLLKKLKRTRRSWPCLDYHVRCFLHGLRCPLGVTNSTPASTVHRERGENISEAFWRTHLHAFLSLLLGSCEKLLSKSNPKKSDHDKGVPPKYVRLALRPDHSSMFSVSKTCNSVQEKETQYSAPVSIIGTQSLTREHQSF